MAMLDGRVAGAEAAAARAEAEMISKGRAMAHAGSVDKSAGWAVAEARVQAWAGQADVLAQAQDDFRAASRRYADACRAYDRARRDWEAALDRLFSEKADAETYDAV